MTKAELMQLAKRYEMDFARNPVTNEAWSVYCESRNTIAELEEMASRSDDDEVQITAEDVGDGIRRYRAVFPKSWADLWGWA